METTDKATCREIAALLGAHGIENVVISPGSRNTPLIVAVCRQPGLRHTVVIDERSAAFIALGMAAQTRRPVAIVCTSGTAMLNYAPAIAEAYYREIPLIVITADRPQEWIDQDDSQTIRQFGAIDNIVKLSVNIPVETGDATQMWMVNRQVNDALIAVTDGRQGPVHINVQLDIPIGRTVETGPIAAPRKIEITTPSALLPTTEARRLGALLAPPRKVLVIAGFLPPDRRINRALDRLATIPNVAVMHEAQANIHAHGTIANIDTVLSQMSEQERHEMLPDTVITIGGSLVSRYIKGWLRAHDGLQHWHVGMRGQAVDCFMHLTRRIEIPAESFMPQLASAMQPFSKSDSEYGARWRAFAERAIKRHEEFVESCEWCDLKAVSSFIKAVPSRANLHAGNGTAVRYVQLCDYSHIHRIDSNRGVSGIDGCTSTAIGASLCYGDLTVLLSGDMSAQYDLGAFACSHIPPTFRMAVLDNGGGSIFRFLRATSSLPEADECLVTDVRLPLENLADAFGFRFLRATNEDELAKACRVFFGASDRPILMDIVTDGSLSATVLREYFNNRIG